MGKTAIVTGAASGLGFEFSKLLAADGYDLILADKNTTELSRVKVLIESEFKCKVIMILADLSKPGSTEAFINQINNQKIDILVNNAGFGLYGFFKSTDWKVESEMIHLHILNFTHITKLIIKGMLENGGGKILNVSSMAAFQAGPLFSVYAASKAYINSFSLSLSNEMKGSGITVTLLCPGQTNTNFAKSVAHISGSNLSKVPFTAEAVDIAKYGYRAMKNGKSLAIPGMMNKIMVFLSKLLPPMTTASINRRLQERIRA
jgi:short-subunit dehydrogenase